MDTVDVSILLAGGGGGGYWTGKYWTSRSARSPGWKVKNMKAFKYNDFKLTLTSAKPDKSWLFQLQDPHLFGGSERMLPRKVLNLKSPEWPFPAI